MSPLSEIVRLPAGKILIAGGATGNMSFERQATTVVHLYDPGADTWSAAPALPIPQRQQSMVVLDDGRVLLVAGCDDRGPTSRVHYYDPR